MRQKISCLRLVVVVRRIQQTTTKELPSVEEALKKLAAAMEALGTPGLSKTEVTRLRSLAQKSIKTAGFFFNILLKLASVT